MKLNIDPKARSWIVRICLLYLGLASGAAIVLAAASLLLPLAWSDTGMVAVSVVVSFLLAVIVYGVWGGASCLADLSAWCVVILAGIGSALLQNGVCQVLEKLESEGLVSCVLETCASDYKRALHFHALGPKPSPLGE